MCGFSVKKKIPQMCSKSIYTRRHHFFQDKKQIQKHLCQACRAAYIILISSESEFSLPKKEDKISMVWYLQIQCNSGIYWLFNSLFFQYLVFYFGTDHELQKNWFFSLQEYMIRNSVISYKENTYFEKYE